MTDSTLLPADPGPAALPTVSIVIPAYNEEAGIRHCLVAAIEQTVPAHEIIVVDNRSTDGTRAAVEAMITAFPDSNIRLVTQDAEQGITPTRNAGFDAATGTVIGRIDADSALSPDWVEQVQRAFATGEFVAASGPVEYYDMPMRAFGHHADDTFRKIQVKLAGKYVFLFGTNMAITKEAWLAVRGEVCADREDLMHEDLDLAVHLALKGLKVGYVSAMVVGMSARRLDSSPKDYYYYVERFKRTYDAHGIHDLRLLAPMAVFLGIYPALHAGRALTEHRTAQRWGGAPKTAAE
ncbi:glycosyltransferase [Herbiconiux moechotypicola]|uniref:Glycosyltransferase family A protein n=1 Tax=Herbiconiux moechotypicola TaxID=637393 RepID=A0ABN3E5D7_9MICO|nr:glycosyltransferase family 2 protein [Herbiconiux moechotypicola]MCS5731768.1 glycosyltransferase [Herbiconiux moechotypicola]